MLRRVLRLLFSSNTKRVNTRPSNYRPSHKADEFVPYKVNKSARPSATRSATPLFPKTTPPPVVEQKLETTITGKCFVIDGDTIQIGKVRLRLAGIDAPELDHPWGQKAKWELVRLCKGSVITAEIEQSISYDRLVATCYLPDGRDLSAEMVKLDLALDWPKFSGGKYAKFEPEGARKKHWKAAARQRGHMHVFNK